jgi:hypothetical protein
MNYTKDDLNNWLKEKHDELQVMINIINVYSYRNDDLKAMSAMVDQIDAVINSFEQAKLIEPWLIKSCERLVAEFHIRFPSLLTVDEYEYQQKKKERDER